MLTATRRLSGQLISAGPGLLPRPFIAVIVLTTSTGTQGADYQNGFNIGPAIHDAFDLTVLGVLSCDVVESDGAVSPGVIWSYGDNGFLRGFNAKNGQEVNNTTDVPPNSRLRMVLVGV